MLNVLVPKIKFQTVTTPDGNPETIPTNINIEIPLPIPLLVICSPSHIRSAVPVISDNTVINPPKKLVSKNIPVDLYDKNIPKPSTNARSIVSIFVYLFTFIVPSSPPSLINLSKDGITIDNN